MSKNSKELKNFKDIIKSEQNIGTNLGKLLLPSEKSSTEQVKVEHTSRPLEKTENKISKRNKSKIPLPISKSPNNLQASESGESKSTPQDILSGNSTESCRRSRRRKEWNKPIKVTSLLRPKISKLKTRLSKTSSRKIDGRKNQREKYLPNKIPSGISSELAGTLVSSEDLIKTTYLGDLELPKNSGNLKETLSEVKPESLKRLEGCLNIQKVPLQNQRALKLNASLNNCNASSINRNVSLKSPKESLNNPFAPLNSRKTNNRSVPLDSPKASDNRNTPLVNPIARSNNRNAPLNTSNVLNSPNASSKNRNVLLHSSNVPYNNRNVPLKSPSVSWNTRNAPLNSPDTPSSNPKSPLNSPNTASINRRLSPNTSKASSNNQNASNRTLSSKRIDITPKSSVALSEIQKASFKRLSASLVGKQITFLVEPQPKSQETNSVEESQKTSGAPAKDNPPESASGPLETSNKALNKEEVPLKLPEISKVGSPAKKLDTSLQNLKVIQELLKQPRRILKAPPKKIDIALRKLDGSPKKLEKPLAKKVVRPILGGVPKIEKTPVEETPLKKFEITPSDLENLSRTLEVTKRLEEKLKALEEKNLSQIAQRKLETGNRDIQIKNLPNTVNPSLRRLKVSLNTKDQTQITQTKPLTDPENPQSNPNTLPKKYPPKALNFPSKTPKKSEGTPKKVEFDPLQKLDSTLKKLEASLKERPSKTFLKKVPKKPYLASTKISKNFEVTSKRPKKIQETSNRPHLKSLESPSGSQKNSLTPQGSTTAPQETKATYQQSQSLILKSRSKLAPEIIAAKREFLKKISSSSLNEIQRIVSKKFRNHHLRRKEQFYQVEINKDQDLFEPQDSMELQRAKRKNVKFDTCRFGETRKSMIPTRITVNKSRVRQRSILADKSPPRILEEADLETVDSNDLEVLKNEAFLSSTDLQVDQKTISRSSRRHPKLAKLCISAIQTASFIPKEKGNPPPSFLTRNIENLKKFGKLKVPKVDKLKEPQNNKCRLMVKREATELPQKVPSSKNVFTYTVTQHDRKAIKPCHIMLYVFGSLLKHVPKVLGSFIPGLMKEEDLEDTKSISISINYEEIQKTKDKELMKQKKFRTNENYIPPWEAYKHIKPSNPPKEKVPDKEKPPPEPIQAIEAPPGYCQKGQLKTLIKKIESSLSSKNDSNKKAMEKYSPCKTIATTTQVDELGSVVDFIKRVEKMETEVKQLAIQKPKVDESLQCCLEGTEDLSSIRNNWMVYPKKKAPKPNLLRLLKAAYRLFVETDNTFRGRSQGSNSTTAVRRSVSTMYNPPPINPLLFSRRHFDTDTESSFLNFANIFCLPEFCKIWKKSSKNREMDKNLIISFKGKLPKSSTSFICPVLSNKDVPFIIVGGSADVERKTGGSKKGKGTKIKKRKVKHCISKRASMGSSLPDIYYQASSGSNSTEKLAPTMEDKTTPDSISQKTIPTIPISEKIDPKSTSTTSSSKNSIYGKDVPPSRESRRQSGKDPEQKTIPNFLITDKIDPTIQPTKSFSKVSVNGNDVPPSRETRRQSGKDVPPSRESRRQSRKEENTIPSTLTNPRAVADKLDPTLNREKLKSRSSKKDSVHGNDVPSSNESRRHPRQLEKPFLPINFYSRPLPKSKTKSKSKLSKQGRTSKDKYRSQARSFEKKSIIQKSSSLSSLSSLEFKDDLVQTTDFCCDVDFVETKDENEMTFETTISSISTFRTDSKMVVNKVEETKRISFEDIDELIRMLKSEFCDA